MSDSARPFGGVRGVYDVYAVHLLLFPFLTDLPMSDNNEAIQPPKSPAVSADTMICTDE